MYCIIVVFSNKLSVLLYMYIIYKYKYYIMRFNYNNNFLHTIHILNEVVFER